MIRVPLNNPGIKVGESGRIDWFKHGRFPQFLESRWDNSRYALKQKIESEISLLRESLNLHKDYKKAIIAVLVLLLALVVYLVVLIVLVNSSSSGSSSSDSSNGIMVSFLVFMVVWLVVMCFQIYTTRKILNSVRVGVMMLNEKIQREGINVYVQLRPEDCWTKYWGKLWFRLNYVQVFEYVN